ncbi:MAG: hypothetical protein NC213_05035 [Acetobacter sp.]|nr:hypothetical protein [Bacteroides sp.]MCM1341090.1 hypothetical protein [Acetobacter sp.]MCM1433577.1 hypothetical protein [Clostridiales bacterium]
MRNRKYSKVKIDELPKTYKMSFFTELMLILRGRIDARKSVIRLTDENDYKSYTSPFIQKEISLCQVAFDNEKIDLLNRITGNLANCYTYRARISQGKATLDTIADNNKYYLSEDNDYSMIFSDSEEIDEINKLREYYEKMSNYFAQNSRLNNIKHSEFDLDKDINVNKLISKKEYDVTYVRCSQLYQLLLARLAAYWTGALRHDKEKKKFPPVFPYEDILSTLKEQLNELKLCREVD